ncbi:FMN-binding protein [Flavobacteriaceae sp. LMIT009]
MKIKYIFLLLSSILSVSFSSVSSKITKKADKEILKFYEVSIFEKDFINIPEDITKEVSSKFNENNFFKIIANDKTLGYAYIGNAPSKTATYDYLVLFDNDFIITKSKVLIYREEYGGEIGSKRWLKQLIGKTQNDKLIYEDNILAISGATISVRSMTKAVNNLLRSIKVLHDRNVLQ